MCLGVASTGSRSCGFGRGLRADGRGGDRGESRPRSHRGVKQKQTESNPYGDDGAWKPLEVCEALGCSGMEPGTTRLGRAVGCRIGEAGE